MNISKVHIVCGLEKLCGLSPVHTVLITFISKLVFMWLAVMTCLRDPQRLYLWTRNTIVFNFRSEKKPHEIKRTETCDVFPHFHEDSTNYWKLIASQNSVWPWGPPLTLFPHKVNRGLSVSKTGSGEGSTLLGNDLIFRTAWFLWEHYRFCLWVNGGMLTVVPLCSHYGVGHDIDSNTYVISSCFHDVPG